ncbi:glucose-6-phosphate isomerase [Nonlabens sp. YIK11]|uniref:glucose-6-phosphate isomerase n=1 Tax=Nonlabens sp. YIK11 TaxID=1453349 RepID=UPI0006DC5577|nr:glucose-6-phosphate isomerase [Nonlabens sp. YIK11]KQC32111.1 glucose-6-phosphate isomerase [Nonlabens sp. YIK11]
MKNINPTTTTSWETLKEHYKNLKDFDLKQSFVKNPNRVDNFTIINDDFYVDMSKNLLTTSTKDVLTQLARECDLEKAIESYYSDQPINVTEYREVLHTALRTPLDKANDKIKSYVKDALASKEKMFAYVNEILDGSRTTYDGQPFDTVVNIGIGGSDLGPMMVYTALEAYHNQVKVHFVSNVDGDHVEETLKKLNPETTLFIIVSKSFTTQETLTNATTLRDWFSKEVSTDAVGKHFIAVSSNVERAIEFGVEKENIFPMFDWVGGRFSLWSTVGMSIALGIGTDNFQALLDGAHEMDVHFRDAKLDDNIPVQLALLTIWYNNFFKAESEVIIPYTQYLQQLPAYLQQAIMESNGKSIDRDGKPIDYQTGNLIWGAPGTNSQHAFFQLIHQGTKLIPAHFIAFAKAKYNHPDHHQKLMANFFAQTEALMNGMSMDQVKEDLEKSKLTEKEQKLLAPFKVFEGNKPTTTILIDELTPKSLGKLIAMYEHKIFTEGVIWNIYSYDQWGVQLGKVLADRINDDLKSKKFNGHDASTTALLKRFDSKLR